jgi:NADH-quinone oxidoreductase subunit E
VTITVADGIIAAHGDFSHEQLIPLLQAIQRVEGFISDDAMERLAVALETPVSHVYGVATFYNQFRFAALGEHVIEVCRGTACHLEGSRALARHLERRLKLRHDGASPDGRYTVLPVTCLGACAVAPAIKLDGEFYGNLTVRGLDALLDELEAGARAQ